MYKRQSLTSTDVNLAVEKSRASRLDMVNQVTKAFFQLLLAQDSYEVPVSYTHLSRLIPPKVGAMAFTA